MNAGIGTPGAIQEELRRVEEQSQTLRRVLTTKYPVGQTSKEVVWTLNKAKLYRYVPTVAPEKRFPVPLFLVFALINRPYIFDLRPGNSFVQYMVKKGFDVFLLDWGSPGPEDSSLTFDDYVLEYLPRAIRKVRSVSGSEEFSMLGWCIGALISSLYAALRPDDGLRNLILLTAPLDFSNKECGGFMRWVSAKDFDPDKLVGALGNMPGELIDYGAKALRPVENYVTNFLRLWDNLDDRQAVESWHAMNTWVNDNIPMAGGAYKQLITDFYRRNRLFEGSLCLRGEQVDLRHIRANLLNVTAESDHIVPPPESETIMERVGSHDKQLLSVKGGHIGIMAGSQAIHRTWPKIEHWLEERSH